MKYKILLILTIALSGNSLAAKLPKVLTLYKGQSTVIEARGATRIAIGNAELVGSTLLKNGEIVLTADGVGETNAQVWFSNGKRREVMIIVVESNGFREISEIKQLLGDIPGIKIRAIGRRVVIEGDLMQRDLERIEIVQKRYSNILVLAQPVDDFDQKMIYFEVNITEIIKSEAELLGINWSTSVAGPTYSYAETFSTATSIQPDFSTSTDPPISSLGAFDNLPAGFTGPDDFWGIATEITSRINFLQETGAALSLASPRLSARSGGKANLLVGGQVPVITSSISGQSVEYKDFGIKMEIEPQVDPSGNIVARISTEVSEIQGGTAEVPAFRTRRSENDVKLRANQTLVISGLINRDSDRTYNKIKWLGDIPILGALFRSKRFDSGESELVVFITPEVMDDLDKGKNIEELDRFNRMTKNFEDKWGDKILE